MLFAVPCNASGLANSTQTSWENPLKQLKYFTVPSCAAPLTYKLLADRFSLPVDDRRLAAAPARSSCAGVRTEEAEATGAETIQRPVSVSDISSMTKCREKYVVEKIGEASLRAYGRCNIRFCTPTYEIDLK